MRQRVQRQCCTRGRSRPAHPRQLAGVLMPDPVARRFLCARCRAPVLVCSHCVRGQIYCASGCAAAVRGERQRDAAQRYQCSRRGRFNHAARTRRWRERQAVLTRLAPTPVTQSVTHQGSPPAASDAVLVAHPSSMPSTTGPATQPCMNLCTSSTSTPATPGAGDPALMPRLATPVWHCPWCHTPCAKPGQRFVSRRGAPFAVALDADQHPVPATPQRLNHGRRHQATSRQRRKDVVENLNDGFRGTGWQLRCFAGRLCRRSRRLISFPAPILTLPSNPGTSTMGSLAAASTTVGRTVGEHSAMIRRTFAEFLTGGAGCLF